MGLIRRLFGGRAPRWREHWAVFPGELDGVLSMYLVDLGAVDAAPAAGLPVRVDIEVRFAAREDGMPAPGYLPSVQRLEDVVSAEAVRFGGVYVGRVITAGTCRYSAYLPGPPLAPLALPGDDFAPVVTVHDDPDWKQLRMVLAPDNWQQHVIGDLMVVKALVDHGDGLDHDRPVEHVAHFAARGRAQAAAAELRMDGFTVRVGKDEFGETLLAVRSDPVAPPGLHDLTWSVRQVVTRYGGEYDGWGCPAGG